MARLENPAQGAKVKMLSNSRFESLFNRGQVVKITKIKNKGETVEIAPKVTVILESDAYYIDVPGLGYEYFYRESFEYPIKAKI